jgi:hypothetical protein
MFLAALSWSTTTGYMSHEMMVGDRPAAWGLRFAANRFSPGNDPDRQISAVVQGERETHESGCWIRPPPRRSWVKLQT